MAAFLGVPASDDVIDAAVGKSDFKKMQVLEAKGKLLPDPKKMPEMAVVSGQQFIRKGIVGDWKSCFSSEQDEQMDLLLKSMQERCPGLEVTFD